MFCVKGYESLLRQVLQCGRPPGFTQTAAPRVVPRPTRRRISTRASIAARTLRTYEVQQVQVKTRLGSSRACVSCVHVHFLALASAYHLLKSHPGVTAFRAGRRL